MPAVDTACAEAVDLARAAAESEGAGLVGDHLGVEAEDDLVVTHRFASLAPGYVGWQWSVTVARASRGKDVTVDEVCLLPGPDALVAPAWVPYAERLRPGDLGPGDLLPVEPGDDRLVPGWTGGFEALARDGVDATDDEAARLAWELGLGRHRVLSLLGLDDAADRWVNGEGGPFAPIAEQAPAHCSTCGFLVRLGGLLGQAFGVCANEYSPSDGRVVTFDHGCGAHSETLEAASLAAAPAPTVDEVGFDLIAPEEVVLDEAPVVVAGDLVDGAGAADPAGDDELGHG
jgi:hypothetical protein